MPARHDTVSPTTPHLLNLPNEVLSIILGHIFDGLNITVRSPTQPLCPKHGHMGRASQSSRALNIFLTSKTLHPIARHAFFETATFDITGWTKADLYKSLSSSRHEPPVHDLFANVQTRNFSIQPFLSWQRLRNLRLIDHHVVVSDLCDDTEVKQEMQYIRQMLDVCASRAIRFEADVTMINWARSRTRFTIVPAPASPSSSAGEGKLPFKAQVVQVHSMYDVDFVHVRKCFEEVFGVELGVANPRIWDWLLKIPGH